MSRKSDMSEKENRLINLSETQMRKYINRTNENFQFYDHRVILYEILLEKRSLCIENEDYMKFIYATLMGWGMYRRGAILSEYEDFKASILENKDKIADLGKYKIEEIKDEELEGIISKLGELFEGKLFKGLNLVTTRSKLVTFSKTMHFLCPDLVVPIDRKYTLGFFNFSLNDNYALKLFERLFKIFYKFCKDKSHLEFMISIKKENKIWNRNIPKIIDNIIMGKGFSENKNK